MLSISSISDHMAFEITDDGELLMYAEEDLNDVAFNSSDSDIDLDMEFFDGPTSVKSMFARDYLKDITKTLNGVNAKELNITMGKDFPIKLEFEVEDGGVNGFCLLAPRIESD